MNYKPDEATLVSYLYGELEGEELRNVEAYLLANPEERKRIDEWKTTRSILSHMSDKEVLAPPMIFGDSGVKPLWRERYFRMTAAIAASLILFLVAARLSGLSGSYRDGELRIGFGTEQAVRPQAPALTEYKVAEMINTSLAKNNSHITESWSRDRKDLEDAIRKNLDANSGKVDRLVQSVSATQQEQISKFVSQLQSDNLKQVQDYVNLSSEGQRKYIETLLVNFSKYLQEQRNQDIQYLQARMSTMQENTDQFKKETELLVSNLLTSGPNNQKSN